MSVIDSRIAYVTVEHVGYGCDTGCCGWIAYAYDASGNRLHESEFDFMHGGSHYDEDTRKIAREFAAAHFPDTEWNETESDYHCPEDD